MRYQSKINPAELLKLAQTELAEKDPESYKALMLAIGAGLRRGEIDRLLWRQVNYHAGAINVEATKAGALKSAESTGSVPIDDGLANILSAYQVTATGAYVIEAPQEDKPSRQWRYRYRCGEVFHRLNAWLRTNGVEGNKPLHTLRKEAGSLIATKAGIYAASRFLRHADIHVTASHYADHKERVTVGIGALLEPPKQGAEIRMPRIETALTAISKKLRFAPPLAYLTISPCMLAHGTLAQHSVSFRAAPERNLRVRRRWYRRNASETRVRAPSLEGHRKMRFRTRGLKSPASE